MKTFFIEYIFLKKTFPGTIFLKIGFPNEIIILEKFFLKGGFSKGNNFLETSFLNDRRFIGKVLVSIGKALLRINFLMGKLFFLEIIFLYEKEKNHLYKNFSHK